MKININEDFNEAFPDEAFAGFTLKQCLVGGGAFALAVAAALLLWRFAGIGIVECTYIAVPAMFPVCALGLGRYQGQGIPQIIKEWDYCRKSKRLLYEAGEKPEGKERTFHMKKEPGKKGERREEHGRKRKRKV